MDSKKLTRFAVVAALYALLTNVLQGVSYGPLQFRLSEIMTLLAFVDPFYVGPLTLGCAIANLWSPFGLPDIIFGTLASYLALKSMTKVKNIYLASLFPALFSFIIGLEILIFSSEPINFFLITGQIMFSQFVVVTILGVQVFKKLGKNKHFMELIKDTDFNKEGVKL